MRLSCWQLYFVIYEQDEAFDDASLFTPLSPSC
jgi:hypothetical protein